LASIARSIRRERSTRAAASMNHSSCRSAAYASFVGIAMRGLTISTCNRGSATISRTRSPIPRTKLALVRQRNTGTSLPMPAPMSASARGVTRCSKWRLSASSTAAASELPPPRPGRDRDVLRNVDRDTRRLAGVSEVARCRAMADVRLVGGNVRRVRADAHVRPARGNFDAHGVGEMR
jgi:hypothetical protein